MNLSCKHTVLQAEDGLLHFRWYERVGTGECKGAAQHDMILLPGEATFSKVLTPAHTHSVVPLQWFSCYGQPLTAHRLIYSQNTDTIAGGKRRCKRTHLHTELPSRQGQDALLLVSLCSLLLTLLSSAI